VRSFLRSVDNNSSSAPRTMVDATRGIVEAQPDATDTLIQEIKLGGMWNEHGSTVE